MPFRALTVIVAIISICLLFSGPASAEAEPQWPREFQRNGRSIILFEPQIDRWENFENLDGKMVVGITPKKTGKRILGAVLFNAITRTDMEQRLVYISDLTIQSINFPNLSERLSERLSDILTKIAPKTPPPVSLDLVLANIAGSQINARTLEAEAQAPNIIVSNKKAILVQTYGDPVPAAVEGTDLVSVINSSWPLFQKAGSSDYYLLVNDLWFKANGLNGPWEAAESLPKSFSAIPKTGKWRDIVKMVPPPKSPNTVVPEIYVVTDPTELIEIEGELELKPIGDLGISYGANTDSDLFFYTVDSSYYYLVSGRWFKSSSLSGPWENVTGSLPGDFAKIPQDHPKARILASVPGTKDAKIAVIESQIPRKAIIKRGSAAFSATYNGDPVFAPIEGTRLYYGVNTQNDVIQFEDKYYACYMGVWFIADSPLGPWELCEFVPEPIYDIPPNSPKYHVTYVHVYFADREDIEVGYTAGYQGIYVKGGVVVYGTGYYYPAYRWNAGVYHPVYYPPTYKTFGYGAHYNPNTGRFVARSSVYGPYGVKFSSGLYNPVTGAWGASEQYATPYAQWGESVVGIDEQWVHTGHIGGPKRGAIGVETSGGGKAMAVHGPEHDAGVVKTSQGDLYVGKDGNIYKKTDDGWSKYQGKGEWAPLDQKAETIGKKPNKLDRSPGDGVKPGPRRSLNNKGPIGERLRKNLGNKSNASMTTRRSPDKDLLRGLQRDLKARKMGSPGPKKPDAVNRPKFKQNTGHKPLPIKNAPRGTLRNR